MHPTLADPAHPTITVGSDWKWRPLDVVAAGTTTLIAVAAVLTLTPVGEPLRGALGGPVIHCAPATWLLDTEANPAVRDTATSNAQVYTVQVLKSPCYSQLTDGDTPSDGWVGGVATDITDHTTSWQTLTVTPDYSTVTVASTLTEIEMHTALEKVTGFVEWGVWESARAEETGGA